MLVGMCANKDYRRRIVYICGTQLAPCKLFEVTFLRRRTIEASDQGRMPTLLVGVYIGSASLSIRALQHAHHKKPLRWKSMFAAMSQLPLTEALKSTCVGTA